MASATTSPAAKPSPLQIISGGQDDRGIAAAEPCVPSEVLLLGDEHVVGVVDPLGGVIPALRYALVLGAAPPELSGQLRYVGLRDWIPGHGGPPGEVEQRGVKHFLEERPLPRSGSGDPLEQECRHKEPHGADDRHRRPPLPVRVTMMPAAASRIAMPVRMASTSCPRWWLAAAARCRRTRLGSSCRSWMAWPAPLGVRGASCTVVMGGSSGYRTTSSIRRTRRAPVRRPPGRSPARRSPGHRGARRPHPASGRGSSRC